MTSHILAQQWHNPSDVLSILLLLGPETVQLAIAQLSGRLVTPVAFSFGWVAFSANALLAVLGDGQLMPQSEIRNLLVIGAKSQFIRQNNSWVVGRLFRDLDAAADREMENREMEHVPPVGSPHRPRFLPVSSPSPKGHGGKRSWEALRISVYKTVDDEHRGGVVSIDWIWIASWVSIAAQLSISIIPWALSEEAAWQPFFITASGTLLSLLSSSLPQWKQEKWASPRRGGSTVTLTRGNGYRHAITILGRQGIGLDIEILATGTRTTTAPILTRILSAAFAVLWLALLITVAGLSQQTWYVLGVGLLGSVQNIIASAVPRKPSALGFHLELVEILRGKSVSEVLKAAETKYPSVGASLLPIFFPVFSSSMRVAAPDIPFWQGVKQRGHQENRHGIRVDDIPYDSPFPEPEQQQDSEATIES
ncbi:hypothetical protein F52700_7527 [Fusarium sp. NRRL 52700]|nr:hypothetical protein F52700_7527 [Fusarium sp. NRRL 52700]